MRRTVPEPLAASTSSGGFQFDLRSVTRDGSGRVRAHVSVTSESGGGPTAEVGHTILARVYLDDGPAPSEVTVTGA